MRARAGIAAGVTVLLMVVSQATALAGAPSSGTVRQISAVEGKKFSGRVADFTGITHDGMVPLSATIDWGDGTAADSGDVVAGVDEADYAVFGKHTYAKAGPVTVTVVLYAHQDVSYSVTAVGTVTVKRDTVAPLTKLRFGPNRVAITDRTPRFKFGSNEPGSRFVCRLDHRRFHPCASPLTTRQLGFGQHILEVRAVDHYKNFDYSPYKVVFDILRFGKAPECPNHGQGRKATIWRSPLLFVTDRPIYGTEGDDVIVGTATYGEVGAGRDVIYGLGGSDTICGYGGRDLVRAGSGNDRVELGVPPPDQNAAALDSVRFLGEEGQDELIGQDGADRIYGGPGSDLLVGGFGRDLLSGQEDQDRVLGGPEFDRLFGGDGGDQLQGNAGNDTIRGGPGLDFLWGDRGTSTEGEGPNLPKLAAGNDELIGEEGPDGLDGGPFTDECESQADDLYRDNCEGLAFP